MKNLLIKYGYTATEITNEFTKKNYKAILWNNGNVTISVYTPKFKRNLLQDRTYTNKKDLKERLSNQ